MRLLFAGLAVSVVALSGGHVAAQGALVSKVFAKAFAKGAAAGAPKVGAKAASKSTTAATIAAPTSNALQTSEAGGIVSQYGPKAGLSTAKGVGKQNQRATSDCEKKGLGTQRKLVVLKECAPALSAKQKKP